MGTEIKEGILMQYTYTEPTLSKKGAQLRDLLVKYLDIFSTGSPMTLPKN